MRTPGAKALWLTPAAQGTASVACSLVELKPRRRLSTAPEGEPIMGLGTILIILLVLALVGALPSWGWSRGWGYFPSGGLGLILVIVVILVLIGRI
jgi:hypothetical protein